MVDQAATSKAGRAKAPAKSKAAPTAVVSHSRPLEIEEPLNRFLVHPTARALVTLLIPTGITPNAVSVLSVVMMALACACYALLPWPQGAFAGLLFHFLWHVFDGADGDLARRTGRSSPIGEIVDGVCDHLSHLILYLTLGFILAGTVGPWGWALTVVSAASRAFQAVCYETQRRTYRRWVYGVNWIRQDLGKAEAQARPGGAGRIGVKLAEVYLGMSGWVRADDSRVEAALERILQKGGPRAVQARTLCRAEMLPLVKRASWLSTNWETVGVFLTILATSPVWFLAFQATVINAVMAACVIGQRGRYARLAARLEALAA
jgi:phosphatidylglycerophosphate synthase